jgi:hypothetical protein
MPWLYTLLYNIKEGKEKKKKDHDDTSDTKDETKRKMSFLTDTNKYCRPISINHNIAVEILMKMIEFI